MKTNSIHNISILAPDRQANLVRVVISTTNSKQQQKTNRQAHTNSTLTNIS